MQRCMLPAWLVLLLVTWSAAAAAVPLPVRQDLFVNGAKYSIIYPCYRQPALLRSGRVLLAFAEGRNITSCAPPISMQPAGPPPASNEIGGLVLRRSLDEGASWSEPRTLVSGDIDFYTMVYDSITHTVHLMLQDAGVAYFTSSDYGLTWSSPVQLKISLPPGLAIQPAVGHGIAINESLCTDGCQGAGRLIMPFVCNNHSGAAGTDAGQCPTCHSCLLVSDDHGAHWTLGGIGQAGSRECQVAQVASAGLHAHLYVTERNFGPTPGYRMLARSFDAGSSLTDFAVDHNLTSPVTPHWTGIVASILRLDVAVEHLLFSCPAAKTVRRDLSLRLSTDQGVSWGESKTLFAGLSGYSDLAMLSTGAGIIFENGLDTFSDRISFSALPYSWLFSAA